MSALVDSIGDVLEGVGDTLKGALDGDLKSIVSVAAMAYGGFQAGQAAGWWGEAAAGGSTIAGETMAHGVMGEGGLTLGAEGMTLGETGLAAGTDAALASTESMVPSLSSSTVAAMPGAEAGLIDGVGTTEVAANAGTSLANAGASGMGNATAAQAAELTKLGYNPAQYSTWSPTEINGVLNKGTLNSNWVTGGMMVGGQMVSSMAAAREARKQEEQRIKERGEQSSWGMQRNGNYVDINPGQGLIDMQNNLGTNQRPNPSTYTPTRRT